jgi:thiamine biosynthesis lipoprotein
MRLSSANSRPLTRCRPLLGTFVEIRAHGLPAVELNAAVNAAFGVIAGVQSHLSAHDQQSELSRLNDTAALRPTRVSPALHTLLQRGLELSRASRGAFDFTVAPLLAQWNLLPTRLRRPGRADWTCVHLEPGRRVRFDRPLAIDLGGIAKGYAVDQAVRCLQRLGVPAALVNAGGDLRHYGPEPVEVHLRHPEHGAVSGVTIPVRNQSLATSSPCFTRRRQGPRLVSHWINGRTRRPITGAISVSVRAEECWAADALTKVAVQGGDSTGELLQGYNAEVFFITA